MLAKILWIAGAAIFLILGCLHLYYTFFTAKFNTRNKSVGEDMKTSSPVLTKQTTMWKAWIGFNASHSAGSIFIGLINIILAVEYFPLLQNSPALLLLNIITVAFYLFLAKKYWFNIPVAGILISNCLFIASALINLLG